MKRLKKIVKNVWNFLLCREDENQVTHAEPQEVKTATKEKIYTFKDLEFRHDNYSKMVYANIEFNNGYRMRVSVEDYSENLENHEAPAGYKITIFNHEGKENSTYLNKNGKGLVVYNQRSVTTLMKQIQQLDERGNISAGHCAAMIKARKQKLLEEQKYRQAYKKNHPEEGGSGVIVADTIAANIISGNEKRPITPAVALEYKRKQSHHQ